MRRVKHDPVKAIRLGWEQGHVSDITNLAADDFADDPLVGAAMDVEFICAAASEGYEAMPERDDLDEKYAYLEGRRLTGVSHEEG